LIFSLSGFSANHTTRYLAPLYPALPILWAALFFHFKKRIPALAWFILLLVLGGNGYGLYQWCLVFDPVKAGKYQQKMKDDQSLIAYLHQRGLREVYVVDYWRAVPLTFGADEKIIFAQPYHDRFPFFTRLVDRSPRPAFLNTGNEGVFDKTVQAIGGSHKKAGHWLYYDFEPPPFDFIELLTKGWQAQPNGPSAAASSAFDRDLSTRWNLGGPMKPGESFQLDLGETVPDVSRVVLFAGSPEGVPRGLRLELSQDAKTFKTLVDIPDYWISLSWSGPRPFFRVEKGITELVFSPQAGRYLKITQTGTDSQNAWEIAEVLVYRGIPRVQKGPQEGIPSRSALMGRLRTLKEKRVLADPWIQAQIAFELPAGKDGGLPVGLPETVGDRLPPYPFPAIIAGRGQSEALREELNQVAPGVYSEERINDLVLFLGPGNGKGYRKLSPAGWQVSSNYNGREAEKAIDGKIKTRWSSGRPQVPGMSFRVDLGQPEKIARIRLRLGDSYHDFPRRAEIRFSLDGFRWEKAVPLNTPVYWTGEKLFKDYSSGETDLVFRETPARFVEILQTGQNPVYYWSIHELELFASE